MRRSAGIYFFLLAVLVGVYIFINNRPPKGEDESSFPTPIPVEYLFSPTDGFPIQIRIESKTSGMIELARNEENAWAVTLPIETAADQGTVEAAAGQVTTIRILDHIPDLSKDSIGLDDPEFIFTIQFSGNVERIINIGVPTPTGSGYYANYDGGEVMIISNTGLDTLIGFVTNPPYRAIETPLLSTPEADTTP